MPLDSRQIRSFVVLCEEMHFGRAAERLGIAQSALSGQIRRIEDVLGTRLLERGRRAAVALTAAGRTFHDEALATIRQLDRAERIGRLAGRGAAGNATLGYVFSAAVNGVLARALGAIRAVLPDVTLSATPLETPEQVAALLEARIDMGFLRPRPVYPPGINARIIYREPLLLALSSGHRLATMESITAADLANETFIIPQVSANMGLLASVTALAKVGGFSLKPPLNTGDFVTAANLAAAHYGIVLAPKSLANVGIPGMKYREIARYDGTVDLALAWRTDAEILAGAILPCFGDADLR